MLKHTTAMPHPPSELSSNKNKRSNEKKISDDNGSNTTSKSNRIIVPRHLLMFYIKRALEYYEKEVLNDTTAQNNTGLLNFWCKRFLASTTCTRMKQDNDSEIEELLLQSIQKIHDKELSIDSFIELWIDTDRQNNDSQGIRSSNSGVPTTLSLSTSTSFSSLMSLHGQQVESMKYNSDYESSNQNGNNSTSLQSLLTKHKHSKSESNEENYTTKTITTNESNDENKIDNYKRITGKAKNETDKSINKDKLNTTSGDKLIMADITNNYNNPSMPSSSSTLSSSSKKNLVLENGSSCDNESMFLPNKTIIDDFYPLSFSSPHTSNVPDQQNNTSRTHYNKTHRKKSSLSCVSTTTTCSSSITYCLYGEKVKDKTKRNQNRMSRFSSTHNEGKKQQLKKKGTKYYIKEIKLLKQRIKELEEERLLNTKDIDSNEMIRSLDKNDNENATKKKQEQKSIVAEAIKSEDHDEEIVTMLTYASKNDDNFHSLIPKLLQDHIELLLLKKNFLLANKGTTFIENYYNSNQQTNVKSFELSVPDEWNVLRNTTLRIGD